MALRIVTPADTVDDRMSLLQESCNRNNLTLDVIGNGAEWIQNVYKIKFLYDYLESDQISDRDVVMVVDAFDVIVAGSEVQILDSFKKNGLDIIFSAEANFYLNGRFSAFYWRYYPRKCDTIYHFLNSGSMMGYAGKIRELLDLLSSSYGLDFDKPETITRFRGDQGLYSRLYADIKMGTIKASFSMGLDHSQEIFGCSGGRMTVFKWPTVSWMHGYLLFKFERRLVKSLSLIGNQRVNRDLGFKNGNYINAYTQSNPLVIHLPGTYSNFSKILSRLKGNSVLDYNSLLFPVALIISLIAYIRSFFTLVTVHLFNKGSVKVDELFPVVLADPKDKVTHEASLEKQMESSELYLIDLDNEEYKLKDVPYILSSLKGKNLCFVIKRGQELKTITAMGLETDRVIFSDEGPEIQAKIKNLEKNVVLVITDDQLELADQGQSVVHFRNYLDDILYHQTGIKKLLGQHRMFSIPKQIRIKIKHQQ